RQPDQEPVRRTSAAEPERDPQRVALRGRQPRQAIQQRRAQLVNAGERQLHLRFHPRGPGHPHVRRRPGRVLQHRGLAPARPPPPPAARPGPGPPAAPPPRARPPGAAPPVDRPSTPPPPRPKPPPPQPAATESATRGASRADTPRTPGQANGAGTPLPSPA